jgi:hypothetical protein
VIASVAGRGLLDAAKDLLFVANARSCGTELLRHAHLHRQQTKTPDVTPGLAKTVTRDDAVRLSLKLSDAVSQSTCL